MNYCSESTEKSDSPLVFLLPILTCIFLFSEMSNSEDRRDVFQLSRDWLSVQEVVDAVGSASCGAVSVFIGSY